MSRGYKIPVIENLGTTMDQFDCLDFSDNEIRWLYPSSKEVTGACRKLDGFPYLRRVKTLLLNNNRIVRVGEDLQINLPHLETLMLTNNSIQVTPTSTCSSTCASTTTCTSTSACTSPSTRSWRTWSR